MRPRAPPPMQWSITLRPSSPLELASPLGNSVVEELSRMRADSSAEAHRKTTLARNSMVSRVCPSMIRTPVIFLFLASNIRLCTTLCGTHGHLAGAQSRGQGRVQAAEIGTRDATAGTRSTVVASGTAVVRLGQDRGAPDGHQTLAGKIFSDGVLDSLLPRSSIPSAAGNGRPAAAEVLRAGRRRR